jgi:hypothetical protein
LAMICSIECFFVVTGYPLLVLTFSLELTEEMDQFLGPDILLYSRYGDCVANQNEFSRNAVKQLDRVSYQICVAKLDKTGSPTVGRRSYKPGWSWRFVRIHRELYRCSESGN